MDERYGFRHPITGAIVQCESMDDAERQAQITADAHYKIVELVRIDVRQNVKPRSRS